MDANLSLKELQESENIAELLSEKDLHDIANQVFQGYEIDKASRANWEKIIDGAMDIAKQNIS